MKLEISLAKKDQLIAEKDKRINALEDEVAIHPVFRNNKHLASLSTPSNSSLGSKISSASKQSITSPHPISDESGESEQTLSQSMSLGFSHISKVNSSDTNEIVDNGRWNIPWDEHSVEEDKAGNRRISNGNALRDIEFVSIEKECRVRRDSGVGTTVLARPVPRRQTLGASSSHLKEVKNKENIPKRRESTSSIRSLREIR